MATTSPQKQCVPDALAGAPGTSPEDEGADRPTPHAFTVANAGARRKRRVCVLVWTGGMLRVADDQAHLTVLQFALMTDQMRHTPS